jgi:hypothetical protein
MPAFDFFWKACSSRLPPDLDSRQFLPKDDARALRERMRTLTGIA